MLEKSKSAPKVGVMIGDPCGIGPEVVAKAWNSKLLHNYCHPVLIGSSEVMRCAVRATGLSLDIHVVENPDQCLLRNDVIDIIEPVHFDNKWILYGEDVERCGWATGMWLEYADRLARAGVLNATVMGPISSVAMKMAGTLDRIASHSPEGAYLLLRSGSLMIAHLTDHVPFRDVPSLVNKDNILKLLHVLDASMKSWGYSERRIAVAGLNPHADGEEERIVIRPAIAIAQKDGINVFGPVSPDSVFRQCIEERYDVVVALYHDQGHIAIKTWGFSGNSVVMLGPPYVHTTVAHGTAYELAGTGKADHEMMLSAILNAACLSSGVGFYK